MGCAPGVLTRSGAPSILPLKVKFLVSAMHSHGAGLDAIWHDFA